MSSSAELQRVFELKRAGRLDEAVVALEGVLARFPSHPVALAHLADVQLRRGRLAEAAQALDRAEAAAGTTATTARIRGDLRYREKRWQEAAQAYAEADALGEKGTWALVQLARCRLRLQALEAARAAAARAVERDATSAPAWVVLGEVALREDRLDDAVELFGRAHERDPGDGYAYARLVEAQLLGLALEDREREVEVLLRTKGKGNRHLLGVLARLRRAGGDDLQAAEAWREAGRLGRGDLFARKQEAYALRRAGEVEQAAGLFRACLLEDPEDVVLFRNYVALQKDRGAIAELRATLEELVPIAGSRRGAVLGHLRRLPGA